MIWYYTDIKDVDTECYKHVVSQGYYSYENLTREGWKNITRNQAFVTCLHRLSDGNADKYFI